MYRTNIVDMCPQNQTEWQEASRRLNCSGDSKNPLNRYHCLPVHDLSTLMEFCYNQTRPRVVTGREVTFILIYLINFQHGLNRAIQTIDT